MIKFLFNKTLQYYLLFNKALKIDTNKDAFVWTLPFTFPFRRLGYFQISGCFQLESFVSWNMRNVLRVGCCYFLSPKRYFLKYEAKRIYFQSYKKVPFCKTFLFLVIFYIHSKWTTQKIAWNVSHGKLYSTSWNMLNFNFIS